MRKAKLVLPALLIIAAIVLLAVALMRSGSFNAQEKPPVTVADLQKQLDDKLAATTPQTPPATQQEPNTTIEDIPPETPKPLPNTGMSNIIMVFILVSTIATVLHMTWQKNDFSFLKS